MTGSVGPTTPRATNEAAGATAERVPDEVLRTWDAHVDRLFGVAYRLLGSVADTEDVLQEAFVRLQGVDVADLRSPQAWLTTVVSRLSLNLLTSARARRETYVGSWLPEPLDAASDPADEVALAASLDTAFLIVLEALSPAERVAFVLHDVFGHPFAEVATVLGRDEATCRQLASRARRAVEARRPRFASDAEQRRAVSERFLAACAGRDLDALLAVLAPDVELHSDGGGKAKAARRVVVGADRVARFLTFVLNRRGGYETVLDAVNGAPGMAWWDRDGHLVGVLSPSVDGDGQVAQLALVVNPDKLGHLQRRDRAAARRSYGEGGP